MLKLIFSPYYDGNCYAGNPDKNQCVLGTKHVGPLGLLDELELRAGLSRGETSPMMRAIAYCNAIQKVLDSKPSSKPFYQQSFENDPLGVAQQLLRWRDALCMAGWNKNTQLPDMLSEDGKKRLKNLRAVEDCFKSIGIGERWHQLLNADLNTLLPKDLIIEVDMKMDLLPPVIRKVLEKTKRAKESEAVVNLGSKTLSDFAGKFTLYQFPEQNDAYQWAALQTEFTPDVYVNEDNFTFNQVLKSVGKPLVDANTEGAADLSQLLKLGIALFRAPVNYDKLMSYLSIFRHPIDKDLRRKLRNHLQDAGGFGEYQGEAFPSVGKEYDDRWGMWEHSKDNTVKEEEIAKFCKALQDWIKAYTPEAEKQIGFVGMQLYSQLSVLEEQTNCLSAFIKGKDTLANDELEKVVASICQGGAVTTDTAKLNSYNMLKDLKGLAVDVNSILWLDCVNKPRPRYEYAFLNPSDIDKLRLDIPKPELEMLASDFAEKLAVSRAGSIIALIPQRKNGERTDEHLLITELKTVCPTIPNSASSLSNSVTENVVPEDVNTQKVEYQVDEDLFKNIKTYLSEKKETDDTGKEVETSNDDAVGYKREEQSYSSLSELINHPFDYVLDYVFKFKDKEEEKHLSTIEGNVAHNVIHQMVEECKKDTSAFLKMCSDSKALNKKLDKAIQDCGLELLLPENSLEVRIFRHTFLTKSIRVLARIIQDNGLEIADSEVNYGVVKGTEFNYQGYIDFVLKKKNKDIDEYYIFDFKWTTYPDGREEELMQRKELQLALYEKIMTEKKMKVAMRGYYLLKQGKLLTTYDRFKNDEAITVVKQSSSCDIFEQAVNSYKERVDNLFAGIIEEGGGMSGAKFTDTEFIKKYLPKMDNYYLDNGLKKNAISKKELKMGGKKDDNFGKNGVLKGKIK